MLNRAVLIVRPAEPFLAWIRSIAGFAPRADNEQVAYLIPSLGIADDVDEALPNLYSMVFEHQLSGWEPDAEEWPKERSFATFKAWFEIELHSELEDLCTSPIVDEVPWAD